MSEGQNSYSQDNTRDEDQSPSIPNSRTSHNNSGLLANQSNAPNPTHIPGINQPGAVTDPQIPSQQSPNNVYGYVALIPGMPNQQSPIQDMPAVSHARQQHMGLAPIPQQITYIPHPNMQQTQMMPNVTYYGAYQYQQRGSPPPHSVLLPIYLHYPHYPHRHQPQQQIYAQSSYPPQSSPQLPNENHRPYLAVLPEHVSPGGRVSQGFKHPVESPNLEHNHASSNENVNFERSTEMRSSDSNKAKHGHPDNSYNLIRDTSHGVSLSEKYQKSDKSSPESYDDTESKKKRKRLSISCTTCRKRKIKCDRSRPICTLCLKNNVPVHLCIYDDSPWVSSLVKEQSLQTEIDSLMEQRIKLKDTVKQRELEIQRLKEEILSGGKTDKTSIRSVVNSVTENQLEIKDSTQGIKSLRSSDSYFNFLRENKLSSPLSRKLTASYMEDPNYDFDNWLADLPHFKVVELKFQYLFDIKFVPEYLALGVQREAPDIQAMFFKNFHRKKAGSSKNVSRDTMEVCYCLLILQFSVMFNKQDDEFADDIPKIFHVVHMYMRKVLEHFELEVASPSQVPLFLETLILFNNLCNIISINMSYSNVNVNYFLRTIFQQYELLLGAPDDNKNIWFMLLYQDHIISRDMGLCNNFTDSEVPKFEFDDDNFDDIALQSLITIRRLRQKNAVMQLVSFYENHFFRFDPKFYANFHIRTPITGVNKDKRFAITILLLDLCVEEQNQDQPKYNEAFVFLVKITSWILEQILYEESCSKNRCLQITILPLLKLSILRFSVILINKMKKEVSEGKEAAKDPSIWDLSLAELERKMMKADLQSEIDFVSGFNKALGQIREYIEHIDLFTGDKKWIEFFDKLLKKMQEI